MRPSARRQGLGNAYGARFQTSPPRPAQKPDLRRYRRRQSPIPKDGTPEELRAAWVAMKSATPSDRRWRVDHGVVDLGDGVKTATLACQRPGCRYGGTGWFAVDRPVELSAGWPEFCSDRCRDLVADVGNRRASRKYRASARERVAAGAPATVRRYVWTSFDPDAVQHPLSVAEDIVDGLRKWFGDQRCYAAPGVYEAATLYLDAIRAEHARDQRASADLDTYHC